MKSEKIIFSIALFTIIFFNSCEKEVYSVDSGILISSTNGSQKSNSGNEYSMMKLLFNYGTVTPYKKLRGNGFITEQSTSIIKQEGC